MLERRTGDREGETASVDRALDGRGREVAADHGARVQVVQLGTLGQRVEVDVAAGVAFEGQGASFVEQRLEAQHVACGSADGVGLTVHDWGSWRKLDLSDLSVAPGLATVQRVLVRVGRWSVARLTLY